jgi:hypothetical protein
MVLEQLLERRQASANCHNYTRMLSPMFAQFAIIIIALGLTQTVDFTPSVCRFFALQGEKTTYKKEKYHAAAG